MSVLELSNEEILKQLEEFPQERRLELARDLLAGSLTVREHQATEPFVKLLGVGNPEGRTFTDEELNRMLEEERSPRTR